MKNKLKFAVIGIGNIGIKHVQHLLNISSVEIVGICDIDTAIQEKFPDIPFYNTVENLLQNCIIDVINICTPNYLHATQSIQCLNAGIHVICEKPMALTTTECTAMLAAADNNNKQLFIVKQNRYNEPVQIVKKLIDNNILGKIYLININCFWNRNDAYYTQSNWRGNKEKDGGVIYTQFSHFLDILHYLIGYCTPTFAHIKNFNHNTITIEDNGIVGLESKAGALVNFNYTTCSYNKNMEGSITIIAEHGTVKIGGQYLNTIEYQNIKDTTLPKINIVEKSNEYGTYQGSMSNHDIFLKDVVQHLTIENLPEISTGKTGKEVIEIIETIYKIAKY